MNGKPNQVIKKPPIMKQIVAISDETLRFERPVIAWPDVQPSA